MPRRRPRLYTETPPTVLDRSASSPRGKVVATDGLVLRSLALAGEGLTLLPRWLCAEELAAGSLVDVFPTHDVTAGDIDATVSLLYASRSYLPLKVRAFVTFMTELFRNGPPWG